MSSALSSFFSPDTLLRRHARVYGTHRNGTRSLPHKILGSRTGTLLDIIPEEEDIPLMPSRQKAQRRHALNVSPRDLKGVLGDIAEETLLSQDDFSVTLSDISLSFPLPPVPIPSSVSPSSCRSPSPSSSLSSSPGSQSAGLPRTPSSSDDECLLPSPAFNPRRAAIKPLAINKLRRPSGLPVIDHSDSDADSDSDSDSEWYTREFSKLLTLHSQLPQCSFPAQRDSVSLDYPSPISPSFPERRRRTSSGLRHAIARVPPVPLIPVQYLSPDSIATRRRPPPSMSIPDDACSAFSLSLYTDDVVEPEHSPLSMYSRESIPDFIKDEQDIEFPDGFEMQVDCPMMLPLSIPSSPIDLKADIAIGLAQLRLKELANSSVDVVQAVMPPEESCKPQLEVTVPEVVFTSPPSSPLQAPSPILDEVPARPRSKASTISSFSFPPTPPPKLDLSLEPRRMDEQHGLKSKWSSSTLSSVCEQHASSSSRFPAAAKLKGYFQSQHKRSNSSTSVSPKLSKFPQTPSPVKSKKEKKEKDARVKARRESGVLVFGYSHGGPRLLHDSYHPDVPISPRRSYDRTPPMSPPRRSYDVPVSPSHRGHGSQCSASDCGNEASPSSDWSAVLSGGLALRRKPIPVEMFLRTAC